MSIENLVELIQPGKNSDSAIADAYIDDKGKIHLSLSDSVLEESNDIREMFEDMESGTARSFNED